MLFSTFDSKTTKRPKTCLWLWPYLLTTNLRCLQKNNIGHTIVYSMYYVLNPLLCAYLLLSFQKKCFYIKPNFDQTQNFINLTFIYLLTSLNMWTATEERSFWIFAPLFLLPWLSNIQNRNAQLCWILLGVAHSDFIDNKISSAETMTAKE